MPFNPFINRETPLYVRGEKYPYTQIRELTHKNWFDVFGFAPCAWSRDRGATHTLIVDNTYIGALFTKTRPARLLKTVIYVGVDEQADDIVWEKWKIKHIYHSLGYADGHNLDAPRFTNTNVETLFMK
jgi:hypothetical protein